MTGPDKNLFLSFVLLLRCVNSVTSPSRKAELTSPASRKRKSVIGAPWMKGSVCLLTVPFVVDVLFRLIIVLTTS